MHCAQKYNTENAEGGEVACKWQLANSSRSDDGFLLYLVIRDSRLNRHRARAASLAARVRAL